MSTKVTDLTELATTPDDTDVLHIVDVGDGTGGTAGTSKKIQVSNLLASAGAVDSVNGATGIVVLEMNDIDDVNAATPADNIVLSYDTATSKYIADTRLTVLYNEFRNGTAVNVYADGLTATQGRIELTATGANLKTGVTGIDVTETSPGDIDFIVATDATGSTTYTAVQLSGTTTANIADLLLAVGTQFKIAGSSGGEAYIRNHPSAAQNTTLTIPNGTGTLALTTDIPTNTNLANTDLTLTNTRVHDIDGNSLEFNTNGGDFFVKDGVTTRIEVSPQALEIEGLTYPATDGTNGQVLTTNGAGSLSFTTVSGGGGTPLASADQTLTGNRIIDTNGYNLNVELSTATDKFIVHDGTHDLFEVDTTTSGTLFSVNDVSGLPMFQSNSDGTAAIPQILTAAPTGTATEGTMQFGIVSGTCYLYVYLNGGWKSTTLT